MVAQKGRSERWRVARGCGGDATRVTGLDGAFGSSGQCKDNPSPDCQCSSHNQYTKSSREFTFWKRVLVQTFDLQAVIPKLDQRNPFGWLQHPIQVDGHAKKRRPAKEHKDPTYCP